MKFKYTWPFGYGPIDGTLMILIFIFFIIPVTFLTLSIENGIKEAWKIMREM